MKSAYSGKRKRNDTEVSKPVLVNRCNNYMGGIDRNDAMLWNYSSMRKSHKWRTQLAFHFMEEPLLNSSYSTIKWWAMKDYLSVVKASYSLSAYKIWSAFSTNPSKTCAICTKNEKRKESRYQCKNCPQNPGFCLAPCFELYHTGQ